MDTCPAPQSQDTYEERLRGQMDRFSVAAKQAQGSFGMFSPLEVAALMAMMTHEEALCIMQTSHSWCLLCHEANDA